MTRKFYPQKSIDIKASTPHPAGTTYKVSIGQEDWGNGEFKFVSKVQMSYNGCVSGRKSPSYPIDSKDEDLVYQCIKELRMTLIQEKENA